MALADDLARLRSLDGFKWTRYADDVIPAWVADMDLPPAPVVVEAIQAVVERGDFGYNLVAREQLPTAFAEWQEQAHGWRPEVELVRPFCDVLHAIETVVWLMTEPGDGIVLLTPSYPPFIKAIESAGRTIVDCPLAPDGWRLDGETLASVIDDRTRIILLCNPHNPTGRVFDDAELETVAAVAAERDLLVITDEVWGDLVHPGSIHRPFALFAPERTVTVSAASKSFNLAGLRCAVAHIGSDQVTAELDRLSPHLLGAVSTIGAEATLAAWTRGHGWLGELKDDLTKRRDHLAERLGADLPQVGFEPPEATYLAWLDLRPLDLGDNPTKRLLDERRIALSPGLDFGPRGEGFARLTFATTEAVLDELIDRLVT